MALVESSRLWTAGGGAGDGASTYTRDNMAEMFRNAFLADPTTQGVFNGLAVSGTASPLTMATGSGCVYGFFHFCTTSGALGAIATPAIGTTGWHVVLRADWTAQTVRAVAVRNADGNSAIPAVTQSAGTTWEIRIASGTITTGGVIAVTDARTFCYFGTMIKTAMIDLNAVSNTIIRDGGALSVIGRSANSTGDPADIAATPASGAVLRESGSVLGFGTVATAGIALNAVDDTIAGDRVPQFYRRQGGSATDWTVQGTTSRTPAAVREQVGVARVSFSSSSSASVTITFPVAFSNKPIVMASMMDQIGILSIATWWNVRGISTTQCILEVNLPSATTTTLDFVWRASGDE
jgi:hypothetical protein